ncbi:histidine phosphatase family protein [Photobacterium kagoshimensis]|uniref:histidine phosphatase family protein n=1 Tax=Photobacterium kagoshimensis TaxID=2910242 RepID=UPI003D0B6E94
MSATKAKTMMTQVDVLRHGLPEGDGCLRGHTDFAITPTGLEQMHQAIADIASVDQIVSSPLQRCSDFARGLSSLMSAPLGLDEQWKELNFGVWDGQPHKTLWQTYQQELDMFWRDPWQHTPHQGETLPEFDLRVIQAWQRLLSEHKGKKILLVTHAGVMRQLLRHILEMPQTARYLQRLQLPYAARYRITIFHDENNEDWPQLHWPVSQQFAPS